MFVAFDQDENAWSRYPRRCFRQQRQLTHLTERVHRFLEFLDEQDGLADLLGKHKTPVYVNLSLTTFLSLILDVADEADAPVMIKAIMQGATRTFHNVRALEEQMLLSEKSDINSARIDISVSQNTQEALEWCDVLSRMYSHWAMNMSFEGINRSLFFSFLASPDRDVHKRS